MDANALAVSHEQSLKFYWVASITILYYDYFSTLDTEINNLWGRRPTFAQCLFYLNRYVPLVSYSIVLAFIFDRSIATSACHAFLNFPPVAIYFSEVVMGAIVILRTRALYAGSRHVLAVLLIVYGAQLVFGAVVAGAATRSPKWVGHLGCVTPYPSNFTSVLWFLWPTACIFDFLVLYLTLHRTLKMRKQGNNVALVSMIHRDGITYFALMFIAKLVNLVVFFAASPDLVNINWVFNNIICIVMINRLVLNIRQEVARKEQRGPTHEKEPAARDVEPIEKDGFHMTISESQIGALSILHGDALPADGRPEFGQQEVDGSWTYFESKGDVDTYVEPFHFERNGSQV